MESEKTEKMAAFDFARRIREDGDDIHEMDPDAITMTQVGRRILSDCMIIDTNIYWYFEVWTDDTQLMVIDKGTSISPS